MVLRTELVVIISIIGLFTLLSFLSTLFNFEKFGFFFHPLGMIYKTEFFNKVLKKMGTKRKHFWNIVYKIGNILALIIGCILLIFFIVNPIFLLLKSPFGAGIQLLIPGVTIELKTALLFIIPILLVLIPHEMGHGIIAEKEGVEIKSSGILLFIVLFGGFVELVEESLQKAEIKKRIKIFFSGSAINAIFALIFLILYFLTPVISLIGFQSPNGVLVVTVYDQFPAAAVNLTRGDIIIEMGLYNDSEQKINFKRLQSTGDYYTLISTYTINMVIHLKLMSGQIISLQGTNTNPITGDNKTGNLYLGLQIYDYYPPRIKGLSPFIPYYWNIETLYTLNISAMAVLVNLLPLFATDGDKILRLYLEKHSDDETRNKRIIGVARLLSLVIITLNLVLSMILF